MTSPARIAYLYSRYPVVSQTFCDSEMMALEGMGTPLVVASINPPKSTFRHERLDGLRAEVHYPPPTAILRSNFDLEKTRGGERWTAVEELIKDHDARYGAGFKASIRARNGIYFARLLERLGVAHVHVHFANRATHTALFIKKFSGIPFSFTAHAQDFMVDLGSDELLRELCEEAAFVMAVSEFSRGLLRERCPDSADKIFRAYNGIDPDAFPLAEPESAAGALRIVTIGRQIEFKGFHVLLDACVELKNRGVPFNCTLIGDGPWREKLRQRVQEGGIESNIRFAGTMTQEEVKAELRDSNVFALASLVDRKGASDILPTVIMEAMGARLPVVSTRLVGIPEMVDDGETGLLVEPGNAIALAAALESLAGDPGMRRRMGEAGREKAIRDFSLDKTAAVLGAAFDKAMTTNAGVPKVSNSTEEGTRRDDESTIPPTAVLVDRWPAGDALSGELMEAIRDPHVHVFAGVLDAGFRFDPAADDSSLVREIEFLPDGIVLEAIWRHDRRKAETLESLREQAGGAVAGEDFFVQARRALCLAGILRKRGIRRVHAARSGSLLWAWILHKMTGLPASFAIEERPALSRSVIENLAADFFAGSVGDSALRRRFGGRYPDGLRLATPERKRRLRVGPLRLRGGDPPAVGSDEPAPSLCSWLEEHSTEDS